MISSANFTSLKTNCLIAQRKLKNNIPRVSFSTLVECAEWKAKNHNVEKGEL